MNKPRSKLSISLRSDFSITQVAIVSACKNAGDHHSKGLMRLVVTLRFSSGRAIVLRLSTEQNLPLSLAKELF